MHSFSNSGNTNVAVWYEGVASMEKNRRARSKMAPTRQRGTNQDLSPAGRNQAPGMKNERAPRLHGKDTPQRHLSHVTSRRAPQGSRCGKSVQQIDVHGNTTFPTGVSQHSLICSVSTDILANSAGPYFIFCCLQA